MSKPITFFGFFVLWLIFIISMSASAKAETYDEYSMLNKCQAATTTAHQVGATYKWATIYNRQTGETTKYWPKANVTQHELFTSSPTWRRWIGWLHLDYPQLNPITYEITKQLMVTRGWNGQQVTYNISWTDGAFGYQRYALRTVPPHSYVLKTWMNQIHAGVDSGIRVYHEQKWHPPKNVFNPFWAGAGSKTKKAILLEEKWWSNQKGWQRGSGNIDPATGQPSGFGGAYGQFVYYGKGVGIQWVSWRPGQPKQYMLNSWQWRNC